jgi:AAHS family 4-hydroxybenzoate transporter-like MFS transporter
MRAHEPKPAIDELVVERQRPASLQWRVVSLCALVALLDGFDTQAIGPAAKGIAASLNIPMGAFGFVFSASQVGFLLGAMVFGALGDRLGRKRLLIFTTLIFAACSLGTALSQSFAVLSGFRFLAGLGLGGASPNFVSLASEYSQPRQRARVVTTLWAAVPLGGMTAAFASSLTLPSLGWRAVFFAGFVAPLILALALAALLPESSETATEATRPQQASKTSGPISELFAAERMLSTAWLWIASFMTWTALIVLAFWTPALLQKAGLTAAKAAVMLALINGGGVVGTVVFGAALTRLGAHRALAIALGLSGLSVASIGAVVAFPSFLGVVATMSGFFSSAAAGALLAVSSETYPSDARSTGVGWALGVGRTGAVIGPVALGVLVARHWPTPRLYLVVAAPFLLAAIFIVLLAMNANARRRAAPTAT